MGRHNKIGILTFNKIKSEYMGRQDVANNHLTLQLVSV